MHQNTKNCRTHQRHFQNDSHTAKETQRLQTWIKNNTTPLDATFLCGFTMSWDWLRNTVTAIHYIKHDREREREREQWWMDHALTCVCMSMYVCLCVFVFVAFTLFAIRTVREGNGSLGWEKSFPHKMKHVCDGGDGVGCGTRNWTHFNYWRYHTVLVSCA